MPYKNKEDQQQQMKLYSESHREQIREYQKQYRESHRDQIAEYQKTYSDTHKADKMKYHESIKITKRCPNCKKHLHFRKSYVSFHPVIKCKYCGKKLRIGKTLGNNPNHDNVGGIRLKVVA